MGMVINADMKIIRRLFHPLLTFIGIQILWVFLLVFWIYWFLGRHRQLRELAERYQAHWLPQSSDWLILAEGILLLVAILIGVYVIFIYWRRQASLNKAQVHFINQVTHELKSPLASLHLHLETIQLRQPSAEQIEKFVTLMESDCKRLDSLITNLLTAGRVEHRKALLNLQNGNLSQLVEAYLCKEAHNDSMKGVLSWSIEPDIYVRFDKDSIEIVLRNLLENAVLYSPKAPIINFTLLRDGSSAHLKVSDQGRGIAPTQLKSVLRMFYRVRQSGHSIPGSGLGLFIVRNIIRLHRGKIWLKSPGIDQGTEVHLCIPLAKKQ
jgi:signal transduction histidine kinase